MTKLLFISILVSLILSSCASLNSVKKTSSKIEGEWIFAESSTPQDICKTEVSNIFYNSVLKFNNNKSFNIKVSGFERSGTWSVNKKGSMLVLGFDETKNTDNRLKTFDISELTDSILQLSYNYNEQVILLKFKK